MEICDSHFGRWVNNRKLTVLIDEVISVTNWYAVTCAYILLCTEVGHFVQGFLDIWILFSWILRTLKVFQKFLVVWQLFQWFFEIWKVFQKLFFPYESYFSDSLWLLKYFRASCYQKFILQIPSINFKVFW